MSVIKVLYNNCYGGFNFSAAFLIEYRVRTGRTLDITKELFRLGVSSIRCDPVAVALVEEKGSEWASGLNAWIMVQTFPDIFERYWDIDEYDGDESVRINVSAAFADCLHTFMDTRDLAALERQYVTIQEAKKLLVKPDEIDPPMVLKQTATATATDGANYGAYFDTNP